MPISQNERDLMAKIADLDRRLQLQERNENQIWKGTAFPTTGLYDRRKYTRSDRDIEYFYDLANTRWLTTTLYEWPLACRSNQPFAAGTQIFFDGNVPEYYYNGIYVVRCQGDFFGLEAQSGTKYFTLNAIGVKNNYTTVNLSGSANTQTFTTPNRDEFMAFAVNQALDNTYFKLAVSYTPTGAHTLGWYGSASLSYRLIG